MSILSHLCNFFASDTNEPPKPSMVKVDITFTDEEVEAIKKSEDEANAFAPKGQVWYFVPKLANAHVAVGLVNYVAKQVAISDTVPKEESLRILDKVIKTIAKVYGLHGLPYYISLWAELNTYKGDMETAKRLYALFLREQSKFVPDKIDALIINYLLPTEPWYNLDKAIRDAKEIA